MITIYQTPSCSSSKKAIKWLINNEIEYNEQRIEFVSKDELVKILKITDRGIADIIKHPSDTKSTYKSNKLYTLNFNDALTYLQVYPELLRTPILISHKKLLVGYNSEEIRKFLPSKYRRLIHPKYKKIKSTLLNLSVDFIS